MEDIEILEQILKDLDSAEKYYDQDLYGSMLRKVHDAKQKIRKLQESKEN